MKFDKTMHQKKRTNRDKAQLSGHFKNNTDKVII